MIASSTCLLCSIIHSDDGEYGFSELPVPTYQPTWHHIPEISNIQTYHYENIRFTGIIKVNDMHFVLPDIWYDVLLLLF